MGEAVVVTARADEAAVAMAEVLGVVEAATEMKMAAAAAMVVKVVVKVTAVVTAACYSGSH